MTIQEVSAERFAQLFHNYHHALADDSGSSSPLRTSLRTEDAWESVPPSEKSRLIAAARLALKEAELVPGERPSRQYFANPGEAEWGC
jgi:hypothetical protein